jgi:hypothetical protein
LSGLESYVFLLSLYLLAKDIWQDRPISGGTIAAVFGLVLIVHVSSRIRSNHIERRLNALVEYMEKEGQFEPQPRADREVSAPKRG